MRKSKRHWWIGAGLLVFAAAMAVAGEAEAPEHREKHRPPDPEPKLVIRAYRIPDLTYTIPDYRGCMPRVGVGVETTGPSPDDTVDDLFQPGGPMVVLDHTSPEQLRDMIQRLVAKDVDSGIAEWSEEGGSAEIEWFLGALLISQTPQAHEKIEALLGELRAESGLNRTVVVDVRWMRVTKEGADILLADLAAKPGAPQTVGDDLLERAGAEVVYRGRASGMDGQTVYIQMANQIAYKADAEPVAAEGVAAFDPTIGMVPAVLGLQVKPIIQPDANAALLDVKSQVCDVAFENYTVTAKGKSPATTEIQVPRSCVQQFQATVHLPLDTDVLIGGMSTPNQPGGQTLYLVVRVSVSE